MLIAIHFLKRREGGIVFAACGRAGRGLTVTTEPSAVTCQACKDRKLGRRIRRPAPKPRLIGA